MNGVGAKKLGMSLEAQKTKLLGARQPGIFAWISWGCPISLREKVCDQFFVPHKRKMKYNFGIDYYFHE